VKLSISPVYTAEQLVPSHDFSHDRLINRQDFKGDEKLLHMVGTVACLKTYSRQDPSLRLSSDKLATPVYSVGEITSVVPGVAPRPGASLAEVVLSITTQAADGATTSTVGIDELEPNRYWWHSHLLEDSVAVIVGESAINRYVDDMEGYVEPADCVGIEAALGRSGLKLFAEKRWKALTEWVQARDS
jgi:hypothetical protein